MSQHAKMRRLYASPISHVQKVQTVVTARNVELQHCKKKIFALQRERDALREQLARALEQNAATQPSTAFNRTAPLTEGVGQGEVASAAPDALPPVPTQDSISFSINQGISKVPKSDYDALRTAAESLRSQLAVAVEERDMVLRQSEIGDEIIERYKKELAAAEARTCHHGWRGTVPENGKRIVTPCPACGGQLFIGSDGHLTCAHLGSDNGPYTGCPEPSVEDYVKGLKAKLAEAEQEQNEEERLRGRLTQLLEQTATALKGQPAPLHLHDWSDLPAKATELVAAYEISEHLRNEAEAKLAEAEDVIRTAREFDNYLAKVNTQERQSIVFRSPDDDLEGLAVSGFCERLTRLSRALRLFRADYMTSDPEHAPRSDSAHRGEEKT